jgi:hypothetical protein
MANDLTIPPRPAAARPAPRWRGTAPPEDAAERRHQPWLPDALPLPVADDFSHASVTQPLRAVALALALAALVLAMGRSEEMVDAAYGLDTFPGSETLIAATEAWHEAMRWFAIPEALKALRDLAGVAAE